MVLCRSPPIVVDLNAPYKRSSISNFDLFKFFRLVLKIVFRVERIGYLTLYFKELFKLSQVSS